MKRSYQGTCMLILAALIWGSSFVVMKNAVDFLTPQILLMIRFALASLFTFLLFYKQIKEINKKDLIGGIMAGSALYLGYYIQTIGLSMTSPGKNAFLTAIYCAIVPFLVWIVEKQKPEYRHFIAAAICLLGVGLVCIDCSLSVNAGDILTVIGGFFFAVHIVIVKRKSQETSPIKLTFLQFLTVAILSIMGSLLFEDVHIITKIQSSIILQIMYLAFFATTLTLLMQNIGQSYVSECHASILLSLESVFGVLFSILYYHEVLTIKVMVGFIFIFIAVLISQTQFTFLNRGVEKCLKE